MRLKNIFLVLVVFLFGCNVITGGTIVEFDEIISTDDPTHYYLVNKPAATDLFVSIKTSAVSSIIVTTKEGCEHHVRTKNVEGWPIFERFDSVENVRFDTKKAPGKSELCFAIVNEEGGTNKIRARVSR